MKSYKIRFIPGFTNWNGDVYLDRYDVVLKCSRGLNWDGGEYSNRGDAVVAGNEACK